MTEQVKVQCPECDTPDSVGRREFLMAAGGTAVTLASLQLHPPGAGPGSGAEVLPPQYDPPGRP